MKKTPRPFQAEAVAAVDSALKRGIKNQLLVMATGLGKTYTSSLIINHYKNVFREGLPKVLWITHKEELIEQSALSILPELYDDLAHYFLSMKEELELSDSEDVNGVIQALRKPGALFCTPEEQALKETLGIVKRDLMITDKRFTVASVQTLINRLDKIDPDEFDIVFVDECHYAMANSWKTSIEHFNSKLRIGLTATPERLDGLSLNHLFDEIVYVRDIEFGVTNNFLCEINAIRVKTAINLDKVATKNGDLKSSDLKLINCEERNDQIVLEWLNNAKGRPTLVFANDVQHAQDLCKSFVSKKIKADFVVGDEKICPGRANRIRKFKSGETQVMVNVDILTAGFDYPNVGCVITATPTKSYAKFMQQLGRGTRLKDENFVKLFGQNVIILDITDNTKRHHLINTFTLEKDKPIEKRIFITKEKKAALIARKLERELQHDQKQTVKVNLLRLPPQKKVDLSKESLKVDATEKQLYYLEKLGYDIKETYYTKGQAMEIIGSHSASDAQIRTVRAMGYDVSDGLTINQAKEVFDIENAKREAAKIEKQAKESKTRLYGLE